MAITHKTHLACLLPCALLASCTIQREPEGLPHTIRDSLYFITSGESTVEGVRSPLFFDYEASLRHLFIYFIYEQNPMLAHEYGEKLYTERERQIRKRNLAPARYGQADLKKLLLICSLGDCRISRASEASQRQQKELRRFADKNEPWAQTALAICYLDDIIPHENRKQAAWDLLQQAKAGGDVLAQFYLDNWELLTKKTTYYYRMKWHLNNFCYLYLPTSFGSPDEIIVDLLSNEPHPLRFRTPSKLEKKDIRKMRSWCYPEGYTK